MNGIRILTDALRRELAPLTRGFTRFPEEVWKRSGALNTWGTNAVEGNTLSHEDVERLLLSERGPAKKPIRDVVETIQHERAFRSLIERRERGVDLVAALELHEEVFHGVAHARPGQWRTGNVFIAGSKHRPPRAEKLVRELEDWQREYEKHVREREDPIALAAWMHHRFEAIHPFQDGNGRIGRLLLNLHLLRTGWPPVHVLPPDRDRYLGALESANLGDLAPLTRYLEILTLRSLLDLLDQLGGPKHEIRELRSFEGLAWNPYGAHYLALRARQEALGAVPSFATSAPTAYWRRPGRARWLTSEAALRHYLAHGARGDALARAASEPDPQAGRKKGRRGTRT